MCASGSAGSPGRPSKTSDLTDDLPVVDEDPGGGAASRALVIKKRILLATGMAEDHCALLAAVDLRPLLHV